MHIRSNLNPKAALFALAVVVSACGGSSGDDTAGGEATSTTIGEQAETQTETETETETEAATTTTAAPVVVNNPLAEVAVAATEAGPRPLFSWDAVDGAIDYRVVVLDAQGEPYWAWSGPETEITFGGSENPDAAGAIVFEPMTWTVAAIGADGVPVAMSAAAALEP